MAKTCSGELRERIIEAVEMGASRREAAELYEVSASSAIKVGAALARDRKRRSKAARRKRFSAGQVRDADVGGDCRTTRPDFGRDRCGAAQAADSYQPQLALAFCRSTPHYSPTPRGVIPFASRLN